MIIGIIDYGAGNTYSVEMALKRLGVKTILTCDKAILREVDGIIFPGVGHAQTAMEQLKKRKLESFLPFVEQPFLGICLGMQLMCESTEEGNTTGLGIYNHVQVKKFQFAPKIPHMGWNNVVNRTAFMTELEDEFYFVHSYYVEKNPFSIGETTYGETFSSVMLKDNFIGCQFHPEKSGQTGEKVLSYFIEECKRFAILKFLNITN